MERLSIVAGVGFVILIMLGVAFVVTETSTVVASGDVISDSLNWHTYTCPDCGWKGDLRQTDEWPITGDVKTESVYYYCPDCHFLIGVACY